MTRTAAAILLALAAAAFSGCQNSQTHSASSAAAPAGQVQTVNTMCPIGRHEWADGGSNLRPASLTRTWKGDAIGFCCKDCVDTWDDEMTDAQRDEVRQLARRNQHLPW
jgi:hypothetical protein